MILLSIFFFWLSYHCCYNAWELLDEERPASALFSLTVAYLTFLFSLAVFGLVEDAAR